MTATEYEGRTVAVWLQLELIDVIQRSKERGDRKEELTEGRKGMVVRVGRDVLARVVLCMWLREREAREDDIIERRVKKSRT